MGGPEEALGVRSCRAVSRQSEGPPLLSAVPQMVPAVASDRQGSSHAILVFAVGN